MNDSDKQEFADCLGAVLTVYGQTVTKQVARLWWEICKCYDIEQFRKALTAHLKDPQNGRFAPKPADIIGALSGTKTDRAMIAWGKLHSAMGSVGAYRTVVFDDPAIHAVVEDMGGWVKLCRTESKDLSFIQAQFCKSYQAYAGREDYPFPPRLCGESDGDEAYARYGLTPPKPIKIGNQDKCDEVMKLGLTNTIRANAVYDMLPSALKLTTESAA